MEGKAPGSVRDIGIYMKRERPLASFRSLSSEEQNVTPKNYLSAIKTLDPNNPFPMTFNANVSN